MRILYLDLDTLRPDHLGCYGYHRATSPHIDRIAAGGVRFDNCYCSDAPCLPSRAALMSGRFGFHTGVVGHGGTCADMRIEGPGRGFQDRLRYMNLASTLKQAGLHTTYVGGFGERHSAWWFYAGFREIHDTGMCGMESAEHVTPTALDWIRRNAKRDNWYLHINYWDPHTPYRAPADFGNPFESDPLPSWYSEDLIERHRRLPGPHTAQDLNMYHNRSDPRYPRHPGEIRNMDDMRRVIDGYDCGIAYMDQNIGRLLAALEAEGVGDDLAIVVSSDHAENMGELGIYGEHATADHGTCRIPMIVRWPGGSCGHTDAGLHYNLDLLPTYAELFGLNPQPEWDGESYAPVIREGENCGREHLVLSQCAHVCQRSVRWGPWLAIRTWHDGFHLFPDDMLFNVEDDPHEQEDLAASRPDLLKEARKRLEGWSKGMLSSMPDGYTEDPMQIVLREGGPFHAKGVLAEYCKRLKATGRGNTVKELKRRHPGEFV